MHRDKPHIDPILNEQETEAAITRASPRQIWRNWKLLLPGLLLIALLIWAGLHFNLDRRLVGGSVVFVGLVSSAFAWLVALVAAIPIIGPLIVKVLAIPVIWLLNAIGYLVSYIAIRRGYSKDVLTYRGLTFALIIGVVLGFVLGRLV